MQKRFKIPLFLLLTVTIASLIVTLRPAQIGGGNYYFIVSSGSMFPTLDTGDWIVCTKTSFGDVQVNDIIAVKHPNGKTLIVHRVASKNENYLTTKGDGCDAPDNFITPPENIVGKYTGFKIPKLGLLLFFCTRTLPGLILTVYVPSVALILLHAKTLYRKLKSAKKKQTASLGEGRDK